MLLSEQFDRPVFVHDYPKAVKAFYMKENPEDPRTVRCNALLVRGYGDLIGGSPREAALGQLRRAQHQQSHCLARLRTGIMDTNEV